jgi:uncharacterized membrane protein YecN with MAPEG domain
MLLQHLIRIHHNKKHYVPMQLIYVCSVTQTATACNIPTTRDFLLHAAVTLTPNLHHKISPFLILYNIVRVHLGAGTAQSA